MLPTMSILPAKVLDNAKRDPSESVLRRGSMSMTAGTFDTRFERTTEKVMIVTGDRISMW